jgi:predicted RecA/RadA family phage recombinase
MAVKLKYDSDCKLQYTPGSAVTGKAIVVLEGQVFIAPADIPASTQGVLNRRGVYTGVAKTTGEAWTLNKKLYWVTGTSKLTTTVGSNAYAGRAAAAADSGDTVGSIALNAPA